MRLETLVQLARSRTPADRSRVRLATAALGLSGMFLLGSLRIARLGNGDLDKAVYSNYVAESGLRSGLIAILVILAALTAGLAVQAVRLGTAARERRLAALRLAGASDKQVGRLAVTDAALAGLAGGLLAGPIYLVLSLLLGALPRMVRVLPGAELIDVLVWIPVVVVMTAAGALIGSMMHRDHLIPRAERPAEQRRTGLIAGPVMVVLGLVGARWVGYIASTVLVVGTGLMFFALSSVWLRAIGRRLSRSGDPANLLTGVRLVADSRPTSRMATLLGCCGVLVGTLVSGIAGVTADFARAADRVFYVTGFALAVVGLLLVVATGLAALIVGVADQLVDHRRQLACLTALGVDARFLRRVIRRQLTAVAGPALAIGLLLGPLLGLGRMIGGRPDPLHLSTLLLAAGLAIAGWFLGQLGGIAAGYLLRNQLRDALDPENLRAA
ncbi:FtsX-like permease family protein [Kribbella sp. CA-247076]|uniref:FtsX-like permease family protein n=1 Tax=Kribbella sp. CA-247076 TaxID=3239941 RepID=UPI003D9380B9